MTSGYAIATLVVFMLSAFFVTHPVSIPIPRPIPRLPINLVTAPILAIASLWAAQCIDPTDIRNGIVGTEGVKPYNILILMFSVSYMAITLVDTGILRAAAFWVRNKSRHNGWRLYFCLYVMSTLISIFIGNDSVIHSRTAFIVYLTNAAHLDPLAWIMAEFAAASMASMVLFVGNPTNVVICEGFGVNIAAFTAYTILPFSACHIFCFVALAFQYRKQVPRKLTRGAYQDPQVALRDPVGAWVGGFMLGATLVLCLVMAFFGIDVWMISLPFALGKFIFDLGWDYYRYSHGIPMVAIEDFDNTNFPRTSQLEMGDSDLRHSPPVDDTTMVAVEGNRTPTEIPRSRVVVEDFGETTAETPMPGPPSNSTSTSKIQYVFTCCLNNPRFRRLKLPCVGASQPQMEDDDSCRSLPLPVDLEVNEEPRPRPVHGVNHEVQYVLSWCRSYMNDLYTRYLEWSPASMANIFRWYRTYMDNLHTQLATRFPTFVSALPRLPFTLIPFAFSQFILIEALDHQGWVNIFSNWLVQASHRQMYPTIWLIGVFGIVLSNVSGTNIGATILLTKVIRAAALSYDANRAAAIALAVASNIGAVGFVFSASFSGLLWRATLRRKGIHIRQRYFAFWNLFPLLVMTIVGLGIVSAEMAVLFPQSP